MNIILSVGLGIPDNCILFLELDLPFFHQNTHSQSEMREFLSQYGPHPTLYPQNDNQNTARAGEKIEKPP